MAASEMSSIDWSRLPDDLLASISDRLTVVDDVRFGAVCSSWRSAKARSLRRPRVPSPWLFFSHNHFCDRNMGGDETCDFFVLEDGKEYRVRLPDFFGCRYCIGSSQGWLVIVKDDQTLCLVNPLAGVVHVLPPLVSSSEMVHWGSYSLKAALSLGTPPDRPPPSTGGAYTVAMIRRYSKTLVVAGEGDESWTVLELPFGRLVDVAFHDGRVYALSDDGRTVVCNLLAGGLACPRAAVTRVVVPQGFEAGVLRQDAVEMDYVYLVGSPSGGLLLVMRRSWNTRFCVDTSRYLTKGVEVFELDGDGGRWRKVGSLRGSALFIGDNSSSLSVEGSPGIRGNCVYVSNEGRDHGVGVFDLEAGMMEIWHVTHEGKDWWKWFPIWFTPSLL